MRQIVKRACLILMILGVLTPLIAQKTYPFANEIAKFDSLDIVNGIKPNPVIFTGSSSVRMWKDLETTYPGYNVLNRGFGGSTFVELIHYAHQTMYKYQPSLIFIYEGDNDVSNGDSPELIFNRMQSLVFQIRNQLGKVPIVLISPKPSVARWALKDKYLAVNAYFKAYADLHEDVYFADVWTPVLKEDGSVRTDIFLKDDLHMNEKGYHIWRKTLEPFLYLSKK